MPLCAFWPMEFFDFFVLMFSTVVSYLHPRNDPLEVGPSIRGGGGNGDLFETSKGVPAGRLGFKMIQHTKIQITLLSLPPDLPINAECETSRGGI